MWLREHRWFQSTSVYGIRGGLTAQKWHAATLSVSLHRGGREKRTPPCVADKTSASLVSFATVLPGYVLGMCVHRVAGIMRALFPEIIVALLPPLLFFLSLSLSLLPISPPPFRRSLLFFLLLYLSISVSLSLSFHSKLFREFNPFFFGASSSRGLPALAPVFSLFFALFALHVVARPDKARGNDIARDKY